MYFFLRAVLSEHALTFDPLRLYSFTLLREYTSLELAFLGASATPCLPGPSVCKLQEINN